MQLSSCFALLSALAALLTLGVDAREQYVARIPNGANVAGVDALGHVDTSGGGARNAFGRAFADNDLAWTTALCQADSDGDGQTNGQELGDPCCVWTVGATPQFTTGVSAPGDAASTADASLWASVTCGGDSDATTAPATTTASPSTTTTSPSTTAPATTTGPAPASAASGTVVPAVATCVIVAVAALAHL